MFSSIDVTASAGGDAKTPAENQDGSLVVALLRRMLAQQDKTNDLLQELIQQGRLQQQARQSELERWKQANPELSKSCRDAVDVLSDVQNEFLQSLTNEVDENEYSLRDSDYMLQEFVDRYGPRLAHLNGVLQVLSQLAEKDSS
ncbi:MAG: hypothetical protein CMJ82_12585 [Planctomycetaceae bacterium]|nr:hypothetical protein [Planctomycetaceae bacterium]